MVNKSKKQSNKNELEEKLRLYTQYKKRLGELDTRLGELKKEIQTQVDKAGVRGVLKDILDIKD